MSRPTKERPAVAVLLSRRFAETNERDAEASLAELEKLLRGLGIEEAGRVVQRRRPEGTSNYVGAGKLEELKALLADLGDRPVVVAVDAELRPSQQHQLEAALEVPVLDRTAVVLRVFEQRANTPLAYAEIELARLGWELPRVRDEVGPDDREGGGGRGGRGHSNTELERQRIRARMAALRQKLVQLNEGEEKRRARRDALVVALVGYTNAGKSSLMRALTGVEVLVEDKLFATLGSTVRPLAPQPAPPILVSDTVGFIRHLPHELVASFRTTLAEARDAGLLLHVVDASDPEWEAQMKVTRSSLATVGAGKVRELVVFNKVDRIGPEGRAALAEALPGALQVSALDPADVRRLHAAIVAASDAQLVGGVLSIPFADGRTLAEVRGRARVVAETYDADGVVLAVRAHPADLDRWRHLAPARSPIETTEELLAAAKAHGLELRAEGTDLDGTGLDFRVLHAKDEEGMPWVVRTPRRDDVYAASLAEARVLDLVRPRLPVAVPDWRIHEPELIAYPRLPGTPAVTVDPIAGHAWNVIDPGALPDAFLDSFAAALVALQSIGEEEARHGGVQVRGVDELRTELFAAIDETADALEAPVRLRTRWRRWLDDDRCWPDWLALGHGDLHPGHMLLDRDGTLVAILDWTEAKVTDPSVDFAMFHGCFGQEALRLLVDRFERAGGRTWPRLLDHAAERWAAFPVLAAAWALRTGNETALGFARREIAAAGA